MRYDAKAIGSGSEAAQSELQDKWHKVRPIHRLLIHGAEPRSQQMTLQEARILTLRVLKQVMEEKLDQNNVQVAQVRSSMQIYDIGKLTNVYSGYTREGLRDPGQCGSAGGNKWHVNALFLHR